MVTRSLSLKMRLGGGAALLGAGAVLAAVLLFVGMTRVAERMDTALAAEARMARYSTLSTQVSTFLVVSTEAVQTGLPPEIRADRVTLVADNIGRTFELLQSDLQLAVAQASAAGLDQQSRHATQSIGLARMQALLNSSLRALRSDITDADRLRAHINSFASGFDPLLNQAVNTEVLFRNEVFSGIERLRLGLSRLAIVVAVVAILAVLMFHLGLIRPQFRRLDRLRDAAVQIGAEDFAVALPSTRDDEIGQLYSETNRMAATLGARRSEIEQDRARLNEIIEQRTGELRQANARLEQTDENRRRFFADISHELRTPLTVILMEAQLGRHGGPDQAAAFATIETRAERLNRRIDDLLRVARSDSGALALESQTVKLGMIFAQVVEEVGAECENAGMELRVGDCPDISVACDPNWARQVVVGLIRNVIRHARDGQKIALVGGEDSGFAELSVIDNGPGISAQDQARVFDRFTQGSRPDVQGFGLGLSLARWVVEAQGGEISLYSPVTRGDALGEAAGTKVCVRLPAVTG